MANGSRIDEYLERIGVERPTNGPDESYLAELQIGQLTHIPFETFDLIDIKELNIEQDAIFDRLVRRQRGGVCCQLNGLFAFALEQLDYKVQLIPSAAFMPATKDYSEYPRHVCLCVTVSNGAKYLCDAGFSKECLTPMLFLTDCVQFTLNGFARLLKNADGLYYRVERGCLKENEHFSLPSSSPRRTSLVDIDPGRIDWKILYRFPVDFADKQVTLQDFEEARKQVLYSPDVPLNHYTLCNLHQCQPTVGYRAIRGQQYCEIVIKDGREIRHSVPITDRDEALSQFLKDKFNLTIERHLELVE